MTSAPRPTLNDVTGPYWKAAAEERLLLPTCRECHRPHFPPRAWCPHCWATDPGWEEASGTGTVVTFSVVQQPPSPGFVVPYVLAVVELDEGPRLMTNVVGCPPSEVRVGLRVRATFERRGDGAVVLFRPDPGDAS